MKPDHSSQSEWAGPQTTTVHGIQACEDFFSIMQLLHTFFSASGKRHDVFLSAQKGNVKPLEISGLSDTRWTCRYRSVVVVKERLQSIVESTRKYLKES